MPSGGEGADEDAVGAIPYPEVRAGLLSEYDPDDPIPWLVQAGGYLRSVWLKEAQFLDGKNLDEDATWHLWDEFTTDELIELRSDALTELEAYVEVETAISGGSARWQLEGARLLEQLHLPHTFGVVAGFIVRSLTVIAIFLPVLFGAVAINWLVEWAVSTLEVPEWLPDPIHKLEIVAWCMEAAVLLYVLGLEAINACLEFTGKKRIGDVR